MVIPEDELSQPGDPESPVETNTVMPSGGGLLPKRYRTSVADGAHAEFALTVAVAQDGRQWRSGGRRIVDDIVRPERSPPKVVVDVLAETISFTAGVLGYRAGPFGVQNRLDFSPWLVPGSLLVGGITTVGFFTGRLNNERKVVTSETLILLSATIAIFSPAPVDPGIPHRG